MSAEKIVKIMQETFSGVPVHIGTQDDLLAGKDNAVDAAIVFSLCTADLLTRRALRHATAAFRRAREQRGSGFIILHVAGYDDDPRELWQVPELCAWLTAFCMRAKLFLPADIEKATDFKGGNDWILAYMAAYNGCLRDLGDGRFEILP